mgnify:CR=1 FL=1
MIDPEEKTNDDYEVINIYNNPNADTIVIYDNNGDQHVIVKEE